MNNIEETKKEYSNTFWKIIKKAKKKSSCIDDRVTQLEKILRKKSPNEILEFNREYTQKMAHADTMALRKAVIEIMTFWSPDSFHYFCAFLISEGKKVYTNFIANPEKLIEVSTLEKFSYTANKVYLEKTGFRISDWEKFLNEANLNFECVKCRILPSNAFKEINTTFWKFPKIQSIDPRLDLTVTIPIQSILM